MVTRGAKASPHKMSPAVRLQPNQARTPSARTPSARTPSACHFLSLSLSLAAASRRGHHKHKTALGHKHKTALGHKHKTAVAYHPSQVTSCAPPTYELRDETASHRHTHTLATSCVKAP